MMDGRVLYHQPFHPFHQDFTLDRKRQIHPRYLRSQRPVRYYYIDFGYAKWFRDSSQPHVLRGSRARERAPEQLSGELYNPFLADIYQLGALLRRDLIPVCLSLLTGIAFSRANSLTRAILYFNFSYTLLEK
jgi:serine/threonine protein kinase